MKIELRGDGLHVSGYVNVPGRKSRPILTGDGRAIEVIEQGAFADAIARAGEVRMLKDHDPGRVLARTSDGTLDVKEDAVGLRAESVITDEEAIEAAKRGKVRGWSFDMRHVNAELEQRADGELPIRHVKSFDMSEISLIIDRVPAYSSTSVEVRGEGEEDVETRAAVEDAELTIDDTEKRHIEEKDDDDADDKWRESVREAREKIGALK